MAMDLPFVLKLRIPATVSVPVSEDRFWPFSAGHDRPLSAKSGLSKSGEYLFHNGRTRQRKPYEKWTFEKFKYNSP